MGDLDGALAQQAPPQQQDNPTLHELPPLNIDGIPTPLDKMTQVRLDMMQRTYLMLVELARHQYCSFVYDFSKNVIYEITIYILYSIYNH